MKRSDLDWLSGLLEGEGCFSWSADPKLRDKGRLTINCNTSDEDIIARAAALMGASYHIDYSPARRKRGDLPQWRFHIYGRRAAGWMLTLYPLMGKRRRARIRQLVLHWRSGGGRTCVADRRAA